MNKELCNAIFRIVTAEKKRLEDEREHVRASLTSMPKGPLFDQDCERLRSLNGELIDCDLILHDIGTPAFYVLHLSDDTANRTREVLELNVDSLIKAAAHVDELLCFLPDSQKLIQARFDATRLIDQARQDLNEFNEVYPKKEEKQ